MKYWKDSDMPISFVFPWSCT